MWMKLVSSHSLGLTPLRFCYSLMSFTATGNRQSLAIWPQPHPPTPTMATNKQRKALGTLRSIDFAATKLQRGT